jgi:hypothetical protein
MVRYSMMAVESSSAATCIFSTCAALTPSGMSVINRTRRTVDDKNPKDSSITLAFPPSSYAIYRHISGNLKITSEVLSVKQVDHRKASRRG